MSNRLSVMLVVALFAIAGCGAALQPGSTSALLLAALVAATLAVAATRMLASTAASTQPVRAEVARDAWLQATITQSPAHTDARALMRPRPPSASR